MSDVDFDSALIAAGFRIAAEEGWRKVSVAAAARGAGVSLAQARERFPSRAHILLRFGSLADQATLRDAHEEGTVRDRLFDLLMRRFDALQSQREGVKALLRHVPYDPPLAVLLTCATERSMRWMLEAAGQSTSGPAGRLRVKGLMAVWLWGLRAWERDTSEDLSTTMAAVDSALQRAERFANWMSGTKPAPPPPPEPAEGAGELDPSHPKPDEEAGTE